MLNYLSNISLFPKLTYSIEDTILTSSDCYISNMHGSLTAFASTAGVVHLVNHMDRKLPFNSIASLPLLSDSINDIRWLSSPQLAMATDTKLKLFDITKRTTTDVCCNERITSLATKNNKMYVGDSKGIIKCYEPRSKKFIMKFYGSKYTRICNMEFHSYNNATLYGSQSGMLNVWDERNMRGEPMGEFVSRQSINALLHADILYAMLGNGDIITLSEYGRIGEVIIKGRQEHTGKMFKNSKLNVIATGSSKFILVDCTDLNAREYDIGEIEGIIDLNNNEVLCYTAYGDISIYELVPDLEALYDQGMCNNLT